MSARKFNVGIIGYGLSAKIFHIPFVTYVPELNLHAIVQRSPKPDNDARKDHPGVQIYPSVDDLCQDEMVDVVIVTTAPDQHFPLAKQALEAGKHVVVEKPFTPTSKEAYELTDLANKQKRLLTVYQNRRWDADFLTLSKYINNGSLGRVVDFETHFDRYRPQAPNSDSWKYKVQPGGGAIYDLGIHLIDQVVYLFGTPKRITAFIGTQREPNPTGFEDSCTIHMHYDGKMATARASVVSPEVNQLRYWVRGDKGSFKKFHLDCQEEQLKAGMRPGDAGYGLEPQDRYGVLTMVDNGEITSEVVPTVEPATYAEYYRKLARALAGDTKQLPVDPNTASLIIRLVELALQSSSSGKTMDV
ncbi:hypothetical protein EPUS_06789 [Endocarpon pusillum Z07020]|uniref:Oxidoreductase n=1 Tax=Endocarpon pusillum (strain Z07020 / HMAS-L-300199) TaxID=1263415 RepID=U1G8R7_ENDPU|nr:uncharacterized protein EPUS_06789 [Endocarpon pusillum Z07020]ERF68373.1 hypothetical protein EPUS_06789 [Endocarpon pusillum Z07020]